MAWSSGRLPGSRIRGLDSLFADHFSPITVLFGLAWRIWPDPRALVVAQAACMATALLIIGVAWVRRVRPPWWGVGVVACMAVVKGMTSAAVFDVHEVGLGVVIMAVLCWGLLERRASMVWPSAVGLLLVKEDLGLTVIAAGAVWWLLTGGRRGGRVGTALALMATGLAGLATAFGVIEIASGGEGSIYVGSLAPQSGLDGVLASLPQRVEPFVLFALTAGIVGLRSPIALLALPTLAWRVLSSNPAYWETFYHYDVILVPLAAFAALDAWTRLSTSGARPRLGWRIVAVTAWACAAAMGIDKAATMPVLSPSAYRPSALVTNARTLAAFVPDGASIAAQQDLEPHLLPRLDVVMLTTQRPVTARWVLLTEHGSPMGAPQAAKQRWLADQARRPDVVVRRAGDVVLVKLPAEPAGDASGEQIRLGSGSGSG